MAGQSHKYTSYQAAIAQLVARRSHNPKVVSSILTRRIFHKWCAQAARQAVCFLLIGSLMQSQCWSIWVLFRQGVGLLFRGGVSPLAGEWPVMVPCSVKVGQGQDTERRESRLYPVLGF